MFKMLLKQPFTGCFPVIKQSETPIFCFKNIILQRHFYEMKRRLFRVFLQMTSMADIIFHTYRYNDFSSLPPYFKTRYRTLFLRARKSWYCMQSFLIHSVLNIGKRCSTPDRIIVITEIVSLIISFLKKKRFKCKTILYFQVSCYERCYIVLLSREISKSL